MTSSLNAEEIFQKSLLEDVKQALDLVEHDPSQFNRRNFVRTVFAAIEGTNYDLRRRALNYTHRQYSQEEIALLREESYTLNSKGEPSAKKLFLPLQDTLRFTFRVYFRKSPSFEKLDFSGPGWTSFLESIKIRHRLTHPKSDASLDVSDSELAAVKSAYVWFIKTIMLQLLDISDAYDDLLKKHPEFADSFAVDRA